MAQLLSDTASKLSRMLAAPTVSLLALLLFCPVATATQVLVPIEGDNLEVVIMIEDRSEWYGLPSETEIGARVLEIFHSLGIGTSTPGVGKDLANFEVQLVSKQELGKDASAITALFRFAINDTRSSVENIATPVVSYSVSLGKIAATDNSTFGLLWETSWPQMIIPSGYLWRGKLKPGLDDQVDAALQKEITRAVFVLKSNLVYSTGKE